MDAQTSTATRGQAAAWQNVSVALQRSFREWIAEEYFRDAGAFADRETAYPMIVYQAARVCHGRSRGMFTYDLRDYPECRHTLALATRMIGRTIQTILARIEQRLLAEASAGSGAPLLTGLVSGRIAFGAPEAARRSSRCSARNPRSSTPWWSWG